MSEATTVTIGIVSRRDATKILFSAEIDISIDPIFRVKKALELAARGGADLQDADLRGANLQDANLRGSDLIDLGQRSDGYQFYAQIMDDGIKIKAGCRYFTLTEARGHWVDTRAGTSLGEETTAILDHAEHLVAIRFPKKTIAGN